MAFVSKIFLGIFLVLKLKIITERLFLLNFIFVSYKFYFML
jgi:hypothetical protein